MTKLERQIRDAIRAERIALSIHLENRLVERGIEPWQLIEGFEGGQLVESVADARPNPKVVVRQTLANGRDVIVVWSFLKSIRSAKLVTVYFEQQ